MPKEEVTFVVSGNFYQRILLPGRVKSVVLSRAFLHVPRTSLKVESLTCHNAFEFQKRMRVKARP